MRIRAIKPDFWTHPMWSRQDDSLRLLAICLLNVADDEGYFYADPQLLLQAQPYWSTQKIQRHLNDLSLKGWINLKTDEDYGLLGCIVNFTKHQVIQRPKPSKIKELWDHGSIIDGSMTDQCGNREQGTGNREQGAAGVFSEFPQLDTEQFRKAWEEKEQHRKEKKLSPLGPTAQRKLFKEFSEWGADVAIHAINESIANNWQGVFKPKGDLPTKQMNEEETKQWLIQ